MISRIAAALLVLTVTTSHVSAAPAQLYGKSVIVSWTENRIQTTDLSSIPQSRTVSAQLSVYVSDKGRAFSRMAMSVNSPRGTRSGNRDAVQGEGAARSISFGGNSMTMIGHRGDTGALRVAVTFDSGFSGCSAHVIAGKATGATAMKITSMATGHVHDVFSIQTSNESCSVQSGNVFGN